MNLYEINKLIKAIPDSDLEFRDFYIGQRVVLIREINQDLSSKGLPPLRYAEAITLAAPPH